MYHRMNNVSITQLGDVSRHIKKNEKEENRRSTKNNNTTTSTVTVVGWPAAVHRSALQSHCSHPHFLPRHITTDGENAGIETHSHNTRRLEAHS